MIRNLEQLQEYVLKDVKDYDDPIFQRSCMMTSPGCSKDEIALLKKELPGIPDSYTSVIQRYNFNGIDVGYFETSPSSFNDEGMVANLIEGNDDTMFMEFAKPYHLYSVATISDFGIFVATAKSPYPEGEIIAIDENIYGEDEENQKQWFFRIAKDFEQFLIIAGNVNQLRREIADDNSNFEEKKSEFFERLKILGVPEEYHKVWLMFF